MLENQQLKYGITRPDLPSVPPQNVELVDGTRVFVNREILKRVMIHK